MERKVEAVEEEVEAAAVDDIDPADWVIYCELELGAVVDVVNSVDEAEDAAVVLLLVFEFESDGKEEDILIFIYKKGTKGTQRIKKK